MKFWLYSKKYDTDNSGKLNYDEFCNMFAIIGAGTNANVNPVFELTKEYPKDVIVQARKDCMKKGIYGIRQLSQILRKLDQLKKGGISRNDFLWGVKELGTTLSKHDLDRLYRYFDKKSDNFVKYPEFIALVRGDLQQKRADLIRSIWLKLCPDETGTVIFELIQQSYDPYGQHDVRVGKTKPDHALKEFIAQWEVKKDGTITYPDFFEFYWDISSVIEDDEAFETLIRNSWKIYQKEVEQSEPIHKPEQKTTKNLSVRFAENLH